MQILTFTILTSNMTLELKDQQNLWLGDDPERAMLIRGILDGE